MVNVNMDEWKAVERERLDLAKDLAALPQAAWNALSLCFRRWVSRVERTVHPIFGSHPSAALQGPRSSAGYRRAVLAIKVSSQMG